MDHMTLESLQHQLESLYAERDTMQNQLGVCDAEGLIGMVQNLEAQLCDMYAAHGHIATSDSSSAIQLLLQVQTLSEQLDTMYSHKSVSFEIENDKPVLRATWSEQLSKEDQ